MKRRQGFTLVELLVAMALIIFMMAILSQAFVAATSTFRNLKSAGDMAEKLRAVTQLLQRDLAADHFEGKKRLSNPNFWLYGPPQQGFFQVYQGSAPALNGPNDFLEGADPSSIGSFRSVDHALAFTIKLRGNQMGDFLSATASGPVVGSSASFGPPEARYQTTAAYNYQWAEVDWFLLPSINPTTGQPDATVVDPNTGSQPVQLFTLFRRQRLAVPDNTAVPTQPANQANIVQNLEISSWVNGGNLYFNSPTDLTVPSRRFNGGLLVGCPTLQSQGATSTMAGSDIQLPDVVSFDVRLLEQSATGGTDPFVTLFQPPFRDRGFVYTSPLPAGVPGVVFDTWSSVNDGLSNFSQWNLPLAQQNPQMPGTTIPFWNARSNSGPILKAIQVSIRIWDYKTNQTRQVTLVQAL